MSQPERPMAGLTQDALQAGPVCPRVPVLSVLELVSRDARRRPLLLPDDGPAERPELRAHLDLVRRHVHEERCPTCRRWYRNATIAYFSQLRRRLRPFARTPHQTLAEEDRREYAVAAGARGSGLGALEGRLLWQREPNEAGWRMLLQFRGAAGRGADPAAFDGVALEVFFEEPGRDAPALLATRLCLGGDGVLTSPEEFVDLADPDRVRKVRFRPRMPLAALDL